MNSTNIKLLIPSLIISIIYILCNINYIQNHHFNEDAYILFRYADMFNKGYGITYFPNSTPIEGATDFLWLLLIICVSKLGIDIGTSAIILNTIGVFIITYILLIKVNEIKKPLYRIILSSIAILWILFYPLLAALGGFSVMLYCALFLIPLFLIDQKKHLEYIPIFAIILGLFRPDGVILGIGLSLISLFLILKIKDKKILKKFITNGLFALIIGISYFVWRYNYFGNLLPLPLYVKQTAGYVSSFKENFRLSFTYKHIYLYAIIIVSILIVNIKQRYKKLYLLLPAALLFIIISGSHQSQNIGFRFQSVMIISMIYVTISLLVTLFNNTNFNKFNYIFLTIPIFYLIAGLKVINEIKFYYSSNSKNISIPEFVHRLSGEVLDGNEVLAITEAGYFSFFQQKENKVIDLVGLNTPELAKNPLNQHFYNKLSPDFIYFMRENKIDPLKFNNKLYYKSKSKEEFNNSYDIESIREQSKYSKVPLATIQSIDYLNSKWNDYDVYFIRYRKNDPNRLSEYVIAWKKSINKSKEFEVLMDDLERKNEIRTYYDLIYAK